MQRAMKASRLVPGGSYTYSTSSLKLSQGGPHLQSNLTTKAKYSTTSNQIREMQTGTFAQAGNGKAVLPIVTRRGSFTDVAMAGKEWLIYMKGNPGVTHSFPLSTLPKTLQLNIIIAFYKCGVHATLHCWYSGIQKQGIRGEHEKYCHSILHNSFTFNVRSGAIILTSTTVVWTDENFPWSDSGKLNTCWTSDGIGLFSHLHLTTPDRLLPIIS